MLSVEIIVPEFRLVVENAEEVILAMGKYELAAVRARIESGQGAKGPLPVPKDGGRPLIRSGQLLASLEAKYTMPNRGLPYAEILPEGYRSDVSERRKGRTAALRRARGALRESLRPFTARRGAAGRIGLDPMPAPMSREEVSARVKSIKGRGRVRGGRNMDIAAILAYSPKDKRGRAGNRGIYDVFHATADEREEMTRIAAAILIVAMVEEESGEAYPGQGSVG